jgi:hypothetical protein
VRSASGGFGLVGAVDSSDQLMRRGWEVRQEAYARRRSKFAVPSVDAYSMPDPVPRFAAESIAAVKTSRYGMT